MQHVSEFLERQRREIDERIAELRPLVEEYERLQAALAALTAPGSAPPSTAKRATTRRAARPSRTSSKAKALSLVAQQPGITIPELAAKTDIAQSYLYKMLPALQREGHVAKRGRGWHVAAVFIASDPVSVLERVVPSPQTLPPSPRTFLTAMAITPPHTKLLPDHYTAPYGSPEAP